MLISVSIVKNIAKILNNCYTNTMRTYFLGLLTSVFVATLVGLSLFKSSPTVVQAQNAIDDAYYSTQFSANTKIRISCFDPYVIPSGPLQVRDSDKADNAADGSDDGELAFNEKADKNLSNHVGFPNRVVAPNGKEYKHTIQLRTRETDLRPSLPVQVIRISTTAETNVDPSVFNAASEKIFCAPDSEGKPTCTQPVLDRWEGLVKLVSCPNNDACFSLLTQTRASLLPANGSLTIPYALSYTRSNESHYFYAIQQFEETPVGAGTPAPIENAALGLKLSTFNPIEPAAENAPSLVNCTSVFWDPIGRVYNPRGNILAPIEGANVTLFKSDKTTKAAVVGTNPDSTDKLGGFSLFIKEAGTFFLSAAKSGYSFPYPAESNTENLTRVIPQIFPGYELYNDPNQSFFEDTNEVKKFIMLMDGDPLNNPKPQIQHSHMVADETSHYFSGVSTYPLATIRVLSNNVVVGQGTADGMGLFEIVIANDNLPDSFESFSIQTEAQTIAQLQTKVGTKQSWFASLIRTVQAQTNNRFSPIYEIEPIPAFVGGFVYNEQLKVVPNAKIEVRIPHMGDIIYATAQANSDGFVYMGNNYLPGLPYNVRIIEGSTPVAEFSGNEFAQLNETYRSAKDMSYYEPTTKQSTVLADARPIIPDANIVQEVQDNQPTVEASSLRALQRKSKARIAGFDGNALAANPTEGATQISGMSGTISLLLLLMLIIVLPVGIAFVYLRIKRKPADSSLY